MSYDAYVRRRCWEEGRVKPGPFPLDQIEINDYDDMPSISIDYALMEKAARVATVRGDFGWSDVGSFEALQKVGVVIPR